VSKSLDRVVTKPDGFEKFYGADANQILLENGTVTDDHSRTRLLQKIDRAFRQAAEQQLKRAEGDFSPDLKADRFPALAATSAVPERVAPEGLTIRGLFALWECDDLANGNPARTVEDFRQKVEPLVAFLGHDDALQVTPENVADCCDEPRRVCHRSWHGCRTRWAAITFRFVPR
jgi:hypothetical protein